MNTKLTLSLKSIALAGAASLFLGGCITSNNASSSDYTSDGQAAYVTTEVDQMGQVYDELPTGAAAKGAAFGSGLAITGELVITPFAYHDSCTCFVRTATYNGIKGYERTRVDSVTLIDSTGATMSKFDKAVVAKIIHKRNVTHTLGAKEIDVRIDIVADIKNDGGQRVGVWNGTMTGTYLGQEFKSGTMTDVTRIWENGRFHFPQAGSIVIDRPVFTFDIEFLGDSKATVTVTNKVTKKVHVYYVDANYNESEPQSK